MLQITQTSHPLSISDEEKCLLKFNTFHLTNAPKMEGAHFQCVNNHYAQFEYKGMKTLGVTDCTN